MPTYSTAALDMPPTNYFRSEVIARKNVENASSDGFT